MQEQLASDKKLVPPATVSFADAAATSTAISSSYTSSPPVIIEPAQTDEPIARPPLARQGSALSGRERSIDGLLQGHGESPAHSPSIASIAHETPSSASTGLPSYLDHTSILTRGTSQRSFTTSPPLWLGTTSAPVSLTAEVKSMATYSDSPQSLKRDYDALSLFGLVVANLGFLQGTLFGAVGTTTFGGPSMLSIGWPLTGLFMCCVSAVLAELASAFPVAGAMMTWTFRLARAIPQLRSSARFLSWTVGSFLLCSHVLTQVLLSYQMGTVIHGTIRLYHPSYAPGRGAVTGVSVAILVLATVITLTTLSRSPWLWKAVLLEILVTFMIVIIALGAGSDQPLQSADYVFTRYENETGYDSAGIVYLLGWVQTCLATGQDAAVHLAEETKNPARSAPYAIFWGTLTSYLLGWIAICVILAASGQVNIPAGQLPHTSLFAPGQLLTSHLSQGLATAIIILLLIAMFAQNVAQLLASSRYCWALARDNALPFSSIIRRVSRDHIPRYAVLFISLCVLPGVLLVALIKNVVTTVALQGAGFTILTAYMVPIVLYIKAGPTALDFDGRRQFSLRRLSLPCAWLSVLFLSLALIVFCFPSASPVDIYSLSWSPVILAGVFILSCFSWVFYGNYHYAGPIKAVLGPDVELPRFTGVRSQATQAANGTAGLGGAADKKPSEPGTTKVFLASGTDQVTRHQTTTGWMTNGELSTEWEEDEDELASRATTVQ